MAIQEIDFCDVCSKQKAIVRTKGKSFCSYDCWRAFTDREWPEIIGETNSLEEYYQKKKDKQVLIDAELERAKLHKIK